MPTDTSVVDIDAYEEALAASWGARVRARRVALGLTQVDLADRIGISQRFLSNIERGDLIPREGMKTAIAHHLRVRRRGDLFPDPGVSPVRVNREPQGSAA